MGTADEFEALIPFCTEAQARCVRALIEHEGNATHAAASLGIARQTLCGALKAARKKADTALRPLAPMHPEGHTLKGVSVKRDGAGNITSQWDKSREDRDDPPAFEPVPPGHHVSKVSSFIGADGKVIAQWVQAPQDKVAQENALEVALRESMRTYIVPVEPVTPPEFVDIDTCAVIPIGDPHIGMLAHAPETGESSDLKIQERDLLDAMDHLVEGMPRSHTCTIIPLGDNFHADDDNQRTPAHHHKLDVDGRAPKVAKMGVNVFRRLIDRALRRFQIVNVEVVSGNHDVVTSVWLRLALTLIYENEPRVWVNPSPSALRIWEFGLNMFGTCHGDGIKPADMVSVMHAREREIVGRTKFTYGFQGHKHKREVHERPGGVVEVFRTLVGKDAFAAKYGYESGQEIVGITYHRLFGEIERKTVGKLLARSEKGAA